MGWIRNINGTVTDERTGNTFISASVGESLGYGGGTAAPEAAKSFNIPIPVSASSPGGTDTRLRDKAGNLITNQTGSQYWMDEGYTGPEPNLERKTAFSSADYARDWIQDLASGYKEQYGNLVSPRTEVIAGYPNTMSYEDEDMANAMLKRLSGMGNNVYDFLSDNGMVILIFIGGLALIPALLGGRK